MRTRDKGKKAIGSDSDESGRFRPRVLVNVINPGVGTRRLSLLGLGILAVGIWAWSEKDTFNNLSRLTNVALDPAFILILIVRVSCLKLGSLSKCVLVYPTGVVI
ncbi:hypothetical protein RUM43_003452 [Polyplax serrata]|uniref:Uncharacterized protein n=1 Tax=Polyplax serrata TaxID=468196 RepID=A0AAN8P396_POLSC